MEFVTLNAGPWDIGRAGRMVRAGLIVVSIACALPVPVASAQTTYGLIGGVQRTNFIGGGSGDYTWRTAYMVGVVGDYPLTETVSLRPELYYSSKGSSVKTERGDPGDLAFRLSYVQLPLLAQLRTAPEGTFRPHMFLGVSVGALLHCRLAEQSCDDIADFNESRFDLSLLLGTEIETRGGAIGVRYEAGLRAVEATVGGNAIYNGVLSVTMRYRVGSL